MSTSFLSSSILTIPPQNKGAIDNKNENVKYSHSLNKERRKRELQRITKQNLQILNRIQNAMPTYNHKVWEKEAKANEKILANISEFRKPRADNESRKYGLYPNSLLDQEDIFMKYEDCSTSA
jgi:SET domain-containing protein